MPTNSIGSSFTHSCLKVPVNPCSGYPSPLFERNYDTLVTMSSHRDSSVSESRPVSGRSSNSHRKTGIRSQICARNESEQPLKSFMEFYESIPDYGDMNHLSDEEFYRKLHSLKEKQKLYVDSLNSVCSDESTKEDRKSEISKEISISDPAVTSDIHKGIVGVNCFDNRLKEKSDRTKKLKSQIKTKTDSNNVSGSWLQSSKAIRKKKQKFLEPSTSEESTAESFDNARLENKDGINKKLTSYESKLPVKEALERNSILVNRTPKKSQKQLINLIRDSASSSAKRSSNRVRASSGSLADSNWDNLSIDDYYSKSGNSFSDSDSNTDLRCHVCPRQSKSVAWRVPKITVPKPFPLTLREKENQEILSLKSHFLDSKPESPSEERKSFRANPVPVTSRIPLFDKIMNDQENRSREVKKLSKAKLNSMMKPFSFVRREEDDRRGMLSYSSPELHHIGKPVKMFKAKPVPTNLFSSQVYERMREDEYYRTLRKRIRSEELLRSSSLPPSMAAREKESSNKEKFELEDTGKEKHKYCKNKKRKIPDYKMSHEILRMELDGRRNEKITTTPLPFHFETADRKSRRSESAKRCCDSSSKNNSTKKERNRPVSAGTYVLHRDNLASVLRIQSSRERAEQEKVRRREERQMREEIRLREKEFRKNPAWKIISGWTGVDEDLAMRACTRQEEEDHQRRLHQMQMETMMSRVYRIPTLFERQSEVRLPRKLIKEVQQKKAVKLSAREEKSRKRSRKHSVRLLSREDITHSPFDQSKIEYDESYESDPEDDKTCHQSIDGDVEEGTGVEDEIKDEEAEIGEEEQKDGSDDEKKDEVSHQEGNREEHIEGEEK